MGIFGKKHRDEFEDGHNNDLFGDDDDFIMPLYKIRNADTAKTVAPHALTADEVASTVSVDDIKMEGTVHREPESVYKRMLDHEKRNTTEADGYVPSWASSAAKCDADSDESVEKTAHAVSFEPAVIKAVPDVIGSVAEERAEANDAFLEKCRLAVERAAASSFDEDKLSVHIIEDDESTSFADAHAAGTVSDDDGSAKQAKEQSDVESIIRRLIDGNELKHSSADSVSTGLTGAEQKTAESTEDANVVSSDGGIQMTKANEKSVPDEVTPDIADDVSEPETAQDTKTVTNAVEEIPCEPEISKAAEVPETEAAEESGDRKVSVEIISDDEQGEIMHTTKGPDPENDGDVRVYGKVVKGAVLQHTPDGDVELSELIKAKRAAEKAATAAAAVAGNATDKTILFGDMSDIISKKADEFEMESDDTADTNDADFYEDDEIPYYETQDPELDGTEDYENLGDAVKLLTAYRSKKSAQKARFLLTAVVTAAMLALTFVPAVTVAAGTAGIIGFVLTVVAVLINCNIFADFAKLVKWRPSFDSCTSVAALLALFQTGVSAFAADGKYASYGAVAMLMLTVNAYAKYIKSARILIGLEKIASAGSKRAVNPLSGEKSETVAAGAVDDKIVALCGKSTRNITGYLKNSLYMSPFDRKSKTLLVVAVLVAAVSGFVSGYFTGAVTGLTVAMLAFCLVCPACAVLTSELPMYVAAKRLAAKGAMLAGFKGAYELNTANVIAVNTSDLFPTGTVELFNMRPLGNTEVGPSLIDAAAVATAAGSPLIEIFKKIIGNTVLPKVDGVQYEDKMGLTGWIGEKTLLIGNRNLMQGHNIPVPPSSVDQKILRAGYFPVYIACDGVLSLLFVVKYVIDDEIADELQRVCSTGMTVVVNPEDPNTTGAMLCDYFGLPDDAVFIMKHNGRAVYENEMKSTESSTASASFSDSVSGLFAAVSSAINMHFISGVMTAVCVIAAVLGAVLLSYMCVSGKLGIAFGASLIVGIETVISLISSAIARIKR